MESDEKKMLFSTILLQFQREKVTILKALKSLGM